MRPKRARTAPATSRQLDFRAPEDDAWYAARVRMEGGGVLRVMYCEFPESFDEFYCADRFGDAGEVEALAERFRPSATQLQDSECPRVIEGMFVCASHAFAESDVRFYDAVVESVYYSNHKLVEGGYEDLCTCTFEVLWLHGPLAGQKTSVGIENMCVLQHRNSNLDPILDHFLEISRKRFQPRSPKEDRILDHHLHHPIKDDEAVRREPEPSAYKVPAGTHDSILDDGMIKCHDNPYILKELNTFNWLGKIKGMSREMSCNHRMMEQDLYLGGRPFSKNTNENENYYNIKIVNVEKDLSPLAVVEFIHKFTSMYPQVCIFPSLPSEIYTWGHVFLESKEKYEKICAFLQNSSHIIVSSRERPWVIKEGRSLSRSMECELPKFERKESNITGENLDMIKLVHKASKDYEKGKQMHALFVEFHEHLQSINDRLLLEERKIIQQSYILINKTSQFSVIY